MKSQTAGRRALPGLLGAGLLLGLIAAPARAEWVKIAEVGQTAYYLDAARIEVRGELRRAWQLRDWKQHDEHGRRSARMLREYDCRAARNRVLAVTEFAGPMATGEQLRRTGFAPAPWESIAPNTVGAVMLERVCPR